MHNMRIVNIERLFDTDFWKRKATEIEAIKVNKDLDEIIGNEIEKICKKIK